MKTESKLATSTLWSYITQVSSIIIGLLGNIILARYLSPQDFGTIGIAIFFVGIANVFVESGMGGALVRKQNATDIDYSTMFLFNMIVSVILFLVMIAFSSFIADYYHQPSLEHILMFLSLIIIINATSIVQNVKLMKKMQFKQIGLCRLLAMLISTVTAITLAYFNYGIWAMVILQVLNAALFSVVLWIFDGRLKNIKFSKKSFKEMFSFGMYTTGTSLIITIFENIYQLILGRYFSILQVGYFYQAKKLQDAMDSPSKNVIYGAVYSHLCSFQDDTEKLFEEYLKVSKIFMLLVCLVSCSIFLYGDIAIKILFGEKWLNSSMYLQFLTIASFFCLIEVICSNIFRIFDVVKRSFLIEIVKKIIQIITIFIGVYYNNINILLIGFIISTIIGLSIIYITSSEILADRGKKFLINFCKILLSGSTSVLLFYFLMSKNDFSDYYRISMYIPFVGTYIILLYILKVFSIESKKIII